MNRPAPAGWAALCLAIAMGPALRAAAEPAHGLALYGPQDLKYGPDEPYAFSQVDAPKGGTLRMASLGGFTKLNPFSLRGYPPLYITLVFEPLMENSYDEDEPFSQYGVLAETAEIAEDKMSITYRLRPEARFSDGRPVTADDVVFSFNAIHDPGFLPFYRAYYADVKQAVKVDERTVRFEFSQTNPELPLIMGQLYILPRHVYGVEGRSFASDFDEVAVGSGPYMIADYNFSTHITYQRRPDYWGRDLPKNLGRYNFDRISVKVFLDPIPAREALKGDLIDADQISSAQDWALAFDGEFVRRNYLRKEGFPHQRVSSMQAFAYNLRNPLFQDRRMRMIIASMFDFEYCNDHLFYGQYTRQLCFWENDPELYSRGPATGDVRRILIELRRAHGPDAVPADAIDRGPYNVGDRLDGSPYPMHERIQAANAELDAMGWRYDSAAGVRQKDGVDLRFEVLLVSPAWARIVNPFIETLREVGIKGGYRLVQPAELLRQIQDRRYDMILTNFPVSDSPGNEQRDFWTSESADIPGSRNTIGIRNPAIDEAVERIIAAPTRHGLVSAVQVLDRILCAQHYVIPNWHIPYDRAVYWNRFGHPDTYVGALTFRENIIEWWWYDEERARRLEQARRTNQPMDPRGAR